MMPPAVAATVPRSASTAVLPALPPLICPPFWTVSAKLFDAGSAAVASTVNRPLELVWMVEASTSIRWPFTARSVPAVLLMLPPALTLTRVVLTPLATLPTCSAPLFALAILPPATLIEPRPASTAMLPLP